MLVSACATEAPDDVVVAHRAAPSPASLARPTPVPGTSSAAAQGADTLVAVLDLDVLAGLEAQGFGLGALVTGEPDATTMQALSTIAPLDSLFDTLVDDLDEVADANPKARVSSSNGRRLFEPDWLSSDEMRLELTGVFNRLDRQDFAPGTCGEVRFLYRLAYETVQGEAPMRGRLPMTVNVVFRVVPDDLGDCRTVARSWRRPSDVIGPEAQQTWLTGEGPLSDAMRARWTLKAVETSLQTIRWQSTVHPNLAGHVEYLLRVFHPDGDRLVPAPLENTPDVAALRSDRDRREALAELLTRPESLDALDQGTLVLPTEFLATRALATSPRGMSRDANRPFRALFGDEADAIWGDVDLTGRRTIGSPAALLRRLDGMTCMGCHQSHSVGGFHHLGRDRDDVAFGTLISGSSVHLLSDLERREAHVDALLAGHAPDPFRPPAEHQGLAGLTGAPCGLGDPGFAAWTCAEGLECVALEDDEVGTCMAPEAVGVACEVGRMKTRAEPHRDRVRDLAQTSCGDGGSCLVNEIGWAQGACTTACEPGEPGCGEVVDIDGIQQCFRRGGSLATCQVDSVWPTALQPCDATTTCRQDYVCIAQGEAGHCVPPYFVYQLRLDGYPLGG